MFALTAYPGSRPITKSSSFLVVWAEYCWFSRFFSVASRNTGQAMVCELAEMGFCSRIMGELASGDFARALCARGVCECVQVRACVRGGGGGGGARSGSAYGKQFQFHSGICNLTLTISFCLCYQEQKACQDHSLVNQPWTDSSGQPCVEDLGLGTSAAVDLGSLLSSLKIEALDRCNFLKASSPQSARATPPPPHPPPIPWSTPAHARP